MGEKKIWVEVADDPGERARGLMFRDDLAWDRGLRLVPTQYRALDLANAQGGFDQNVEVVARRTLEGFAHLGTGRGLIDADR